MSGSLALEYLTVQCPTCKAAPGDPCRYRGNKRGRVAHLARQDRAVRAVNRERTA